MSQRFPLLFQHNNTSCLCEVQLPALLESTCIFTTAYRCCSWCSPSSGVNIQGLTFTGRISKGPLDRLRSGQGCSLVCARWEHKNNHRARLGLQDLQHCDQRRIDDVISWAQLFYIYTETTVTLNNTILSKTNAPSPAGVNWGKKMKKTKVWNKRGWPCTAGSHHTQ